MHDVMNVTSASLNACGRSRIAIVAPIRTAVRELDAPRACNPGVGAS